jgi:hypothetical protein
MLDPDNMKKDKEKEEGLTVVRDAAKQLELPVYLLDLYHAVGHQGDRGLTRGISDKSVVNRLPARSST